jgi:hypothetical protein
MPRASGAGRSDENDPTRTLPQRAAIALQCYRVAPSPTERCRTGIAWISGVVEVRRAWRGASFRAEEGWFGFIISNVDVVSRMAVPNAKQAAHARRARNAKSRRGSVRARYAAPPAAWPCAR